MTDVKYFHDEEHHNLISPRVIVPQLVKIINPKSVIDVGCGIGTFLKVFKENGIDDIYGLDGKWTDKNLLSKYIDLSFYKEVDLESRVTLNRKFDLAVSLEVAEHLNENSADIFVENLVNLSDIIVFSAAFPTQGGQNHVNEQWPSYWCEKFSKHGYKFYDVLRPLFWNDNNVQIWYKQNIFLIIRDNCEQNITKDFTALDNSVMDVIHPIVYKSCYEKNTELKAISVKYNNLNKGRDSLLTYLKLIAKYFLGRINLYNK